MATNKIQITLEVDDQGKVKIQQFGQEVEKVKTKVEGSTTDMSTSFTKIGVAAAAAGVAVAAAVKVMSMAFEQAQIGEKLLKQEQAFSNLSKSAGTTSADILRDMDKLAKGMITTGDLVQASGRAMMLGIPADKLADLMKIAEATSRQTGQSVTEAFNDITLAVGRQSKMILDNLGIIVDVEKANEDYAKTLGKASEALSDNEKKQAFMNATLRIGNDLVNKINGEGDDVGLRGASKLTKEWKQAQENLAKDIADSTNPLFEAMSKVLKMVNDEYERGNKLIKERKNEIKGATDEELKEIIKTAGPMDAQRERDALIELRKRQKANRESITDPQISLFQSQQRISEANTSNASFLESGRYRLKKGDSTISDPGYLEVQAKLDADALAAAKKASDEMIQLRKEWSELYNKETMTTYDYEIQKLDEVLKKFESVMTAEQREEYKTRKTRGLDLQYGDEGRAEDAVKLRREAADEEMDKNLKTTREWETQIKQINASVTGDKKAMMEADLAEIAAWKAKQDETLPALADLWNKVAEAKTKAIQVKYQSDFEKWANSAKTQTEQLEAVGIHAAESFSSGFADAFMEFANGTKSAKQAFLDFAKSFLDGIAKMIIQQMILNALKSGSQSGGWMGGIMGLFGGGGGGAMAQSGTEAGGFIAAGGMSALGNIFGPSGKFAFADGGIVNGATTFKFAKGTGVMGEAGPEAIMPLGRDSQGRLGIRGGSGSNYNINVNVDGSKGGTSEQNSKLGKQIAREVREEVKKIIADERRYGGALGAQTARAY
jgi:lambda family phage tail tape measure protein